MVRITTSKTTTSLHSQRCGNAWGMDARGTETLRRALVLLSDDELNPSTFAVRVCASAGSSLPAALLAGLATLSGPRHGGTATLARQALTEGSPPPQETPYRYGFGHPLYPSGDPRARLLCDRIPHTDPVLEAQEQIAVKVRQRPNVDSGLAAISLHLGLPATAAFTIFALGRLVGWIAHAKEQADQETLIRPRARYQPSGRTELRQT